MRALAEIASEADRILVAAHATPVPPRLIGGLAINRQIGEAPPHPAHDRKLDVFVGVFEIEPQRATPPTAVP